MIPLPCCCCLPFKDHGKNLEHLGYLEEVLTENGVTVNVTDTVCEGGTSDKHKDDPTKDPGAPLPLKIWREKCDTARAKQ